MTIIGLVALGLFIWLVLAACVVCLCIAGKDDQPNDRRDLPRDGYKPALRLINGDLPCS